MPAAVFLEWVAAGRIEVHASRDRQSGGLQSIGKPTCSTEQVDDLDYRLTTDGCSGRRAHMSALARTAIRRILFIGAVLITGTVGLTDQADTPHSDGV